MKKIKLSKEEKEYEQPYLDALKQGIRINSGISFGLNTILHNDRISWKAKAIALTIVNNEEQFLDIQTNKEKLLQCRSKEQIDAIRSGLKELQNIGLLHKKIYRNKVGRNYVIGSTWQISLKEL